MNLLRTQKHKRRHPVGSEYSARHVFNERTKKGLRLFDVSPLLLSGEGEIRTPGRFDPTPVFKLYAFALLQCFSIRRVSKTLLLCPSRPVACIVVSTFCEYTTRND